jgi:glycosyltransferase involved in cell wall biosynthesis
MASKNIHLAIVIPVYNEEKVIRGVINSIPKKIKGIKKISIITVNDGSTDDSAGQIKKTKALLVNLPFNLGIGLATSTGIEAGRILGTDILVTMDGDGQHDPRDIPKLIAPILSDRCDLAIGARLINRNDMPVLKRFGNWLMNAITYIFSGIWVKDSQSGMKALSKKALGEIEIKTSGYELCSEIIILAKKEGLRIVEVPIRTIYSEHSMRKGQNPLNGLNIALKLLYKKIGG